jgi:transposase
VTITRAEHDRLVAELQALARPITVGFDPISHYHRPLAWRLVQAGFDVRLVSEALARTREALHNDWDKNDPKDALVILHMLRIGVAKPYHDPLAHGINDIQELSMTQ